MKLKQIVYLANGWMSSSNKTYIMAHKYYDGIAANHSTGEDSLRLNMDLSKISGTINDGFFHEILHNKEEESKLTKRLQPTTNGKHAKIRYRLKVTFFYHLDCGDDPV